MPNTVERHSSFKSERRTAPGSADHANPNFIKAPRSTPPGRYTYEDRHRKPGVIGQLLGVGPGVKDVGAVRRTYNKKTFKPGMRELNRGFYRPSHLLEEELRDVRHDKGFNEALPHLAENPELRNRLNRQKDSIYQDVQRLERRAAGSDDPRQAQALDRARERADKKYKNLIEDELEELKRDYRHGKRALETDRIQTMRQAREEIYGGNNNDDEELSLGKYSGNLASGNEA